MPHFKDTEQRVFWLDPADTPRAGLTPITDAQATALMRPALASRKAALAEALKRRRDAAIEAGVTVPGIGTFDSDLASRTNINGSVVMALIAQQAGQAFSMPWKLADNSMATLDAAKMIAAGLAVGRYVAAAHANAQALGAAIRTANSHSALDAINIDGGW